MDDRPVVWDQWNRHHILVKHAGRGIDRVTIGEVLDDPNRIDEIDDGREGEEHHVVIGEGGAGQILVVAWVDHPKGRYPVHAHQAGRKVARRYRQ